MNCILSHICYGQSIVTKKNSFEAFKRAFIFGSYELKKWLFTKYMPVCLSVCLSVCSFGEKLLNRFPPNPKLININ